MQISFDPKDPRDVADMMNVLRILGMIDAAVSITVGDEPSLSATQAREFQKTLDRERRGLTARDTSDRAQVRSYSSASRQPQIIPLEELDL